MFIWFFNLISNFFSSFLKNNSPLELNISEIDKANSFVINSSVSRKSNFNLVDNFFPKVVLPDPD